jgi:transketolase
MVTTKELARLSYEARLRAVDVVVRTGTGHIASAFSICDIATVLLFMKQQNAADEITLVLSKGHSGLVFYALFELLGYEKKGYFDNYLVDGSDLPAFPAASEALSFSSGSLGHGLSFAAGLGYARKLNQSPGQVYAMLSDGECQEGSTWEAANFIGHHQLPVTVFVDNNGLQAIGKTKDILNQCNLIERFESFGFDGVGIDGHDIDQIISIVETPAKSPRFINARTIKGKGVSFMESEIKWHYLPLSDDNVDLAVQELEAKICELR